jgi:hypothetical protein
MYNDQNLKRIARLVKVLQAQPYRYGLKNMWSAYRNSVSRSPSNWTNLRTHCYSRISSLDYIQVVIPMDEIRVKVVVTVTPIFLFCLNGTKKKLYDKSVSPLRNLQHSLITLDALTKRLLSI